MSTPTIRSKHPWYREPWPWLLASGPALVGVASFVSAWIAIKTNDGLVSEDAYREGLAAQETISRSDRATALGLLARIRVTDSEMSITLSSTDAGFVASQKIRVTLSHPTRAGLDQTELLALQGSVYSGPFRLPAAGHWLLLVEDEAKNWRMMGSVVLPASGDVLIGDPVLTEAHHP